MRHTCLVSRAEFAPPGCMRHHVQGALGVCASRCVTGRCAPHPPALKTLKTLYRTDAAQDGPVLARALRAVLGPHAEASSGGGGGEAAAVEGALRDYERQRTARCFKVTLRSAAFGRLLQIPFSPVRSCALLLGWRVWG